MTLTARSGLGRIRQADGSVPSSRVQRGIALVLVLWVLSLLTIMALGLTMTQRSQSALTQNQIDSARFRALADGAVNLAILNLMSDPIESVPAEEVWLPDGSPYSVQFGAEDVEIRIYNESSRIDLNSIERAQLVDLLELAGAPAEQLDALADAIVDWRDADQFTALNGAEDDTYQAEGFGYGAADQPFESVDELLQVRGMTPALFQSLEPDLRVGGGSGAARIPVGPVFGGSSSTARSAAFDPQFASARALAVMQDMPLEDAELLVAERNQPVVPGADGPRVANRGGPEYRIRVTVRRGDSFQRALEVLVRVAPRGNPPFEVLWRREGLSVPRPADALESS